LFIEDVKLDMNQRLQLVYTAIQKVGNETIFDLILILAHQ
jgi:hypothetical protein